MLPVTHWSSYGAYGPCLCEKGDGETGTHKTSLCPRDRDLKETRWLKTQDDDASIGAQSRRDTLTMAAKMGTSGEGFSMSKIRHALLQGEGYFLGKGIFCFSTKDKLSVCPVWGTAVILGFLRLLPYSTTAPPAPNLLERGGPPADLRRSRLHGHLVLLTTQLLLLLFLSLSIVHKLNLVLPIQTTLFFTVLHLFCIAFRMAWILMVLIIYCYGSQTQPSFSLWILNLVPGSKGCLFTLRL